jgi:hypothetical protein
VLAGRRRYKSVTSAHIVLEPHLRNSQNHFSSVIDLEGKGARG